MNRQIRIAAIIFAAAVVAAIVALAIFHAAAVLAGWLALMVWASMIPVGALTLLMIHRLTGGEWGFALAPVLEPAARAIPTRRLRQFPRARDR